jgi:hypothetical protein
MDDKENEQDRTSIMPLLVAVWVGMIIAGVWMLVLAA